MNCRFVICIPVFNNPTTIAGVIDGCLRIEGLPVLVVDDGSHVPVEEIYGTHPLVTYLRHPSNMGKGVALQDAFRWAIAQGYTHLIAIDGDGQHDPQDIVPLRAAAEDDPWAIVVGDRDMRAANVPGSSAFGKKFSNFWVRYQTNVGVADSQSGYRIYPLFFVQNMKFFCRRYDFEIEVLIRLIWKGLAVKNVNVGVKYFPKEERVSHFHKWKDNFRISVLNTFLTVGSLIRNPGSPGKSALALGIGVAIGTLPLYGLHTGIVALLVLASRLNFIYMFIGSNISLPFFAPFLVLGSKAIGGKILGAQAPAGTMAGFGKAWIVGSVVLGVFLGVLSFLIFYIYLRSRAPKKAWTGKNRNRSGIWFVRLLLDHLGRRFAYFFLRFIAFYYFLFSFRTRKAFTQYWRALEPGGGFFRRQNNIYGQILLFAQTLVDRGTQQPRDELIFEYELDPSVELFVADLKAGRQGVVAIASHVGGWEIARTFFAKIQSGKKMLSVMHGIPGQYAHESGPPEGIIFFNQEQNSILKIKDYLSAGQVIGMMGTGR